MSDDVRQYEVEFDVEGARGMYVDMVKKNLNVWITVWGQWGLTCMFITAFLLYTGTFYTRDEWEWIAMTAILIGCIIPFVTLWEGVRRSADQYARTGEGSKWSCELGPDGWSFTDEAGATTSIPWRSIKIEDEHPDAWTISYGRQTMTVFRAPLREAGLEEEFLRRVEAASVPSGD